MPARAGGRAYVRMFQAGVGVVTGALTRVLGGELLRDVQTFVAALDTMFGGFRERAEQTYALLKRPETAFVVVSTPDQSRAMVVCSSVRAVLSNLPRSFTSLRSAAYRALVSDGGGDYIF